VPILTPKIYGSFQLLSPEDERIFAYIRAGSILVVLNFSTENVNYVVPSDVKTEHASMLVSTEQDVAKLYGGVVELQPYGGVMYSL
jgi:hypothetical protein